MEEQLPGMLLVIAGPLEPEALFQPRIRHPAEHRRERADLVPQVLGGRVAEVVPETRGDLRQDPELVAGVPWWIERLAHALDAPLAARDGPLCLAPGGGGREHHVRELRRRGEEDVLHDEE